MKMMAVVNQRRTFLNLVYITTNLDFAISNVSSKFDRLPPEKLKGKKIFQMCPGLNEAEAMTALGECKPLTSEMELRGKNYLCEVRITKLERK